ncbi:MAG: hypothetical protein H0X02_12910, partial [Nitrosomonas sp.]|nr:hypothetical protein [Nitrosomonas sp.]
AIVVVFGLTTATLMTMVVMPMVYHWFDDIPDKKTSEQPEEQPATVIAQSAVKDA